MSADSNVTGPAKHVFQPVGGIPAVTKSASAEHLSADLDLWSWDFTDEESRLRVGKLPACRVKSLSQEKQALDAMSSPKGSYSFGCTFDDAKILV